MRIFRDSDDDHDDEKPRNSADPAAQAEVLADEILDWLDERDRANTTPQTPMASVTPLFPVTTNPTIASETVAAEGPRPVTTPAPTATPHTRGQIWRASAASSFVVVGASTVAIWGQPAEVGVPITVYGLGWVAYLIWNSARRPSPSIALAAFTERRAARVQRAAP
ncbi:hypothetical protein [Nocardia jejuensis]|uniref:hypothetical protein n=1 Tax=Nocardia jejuensis TaxID=328049 RepID=UPI00083314F4|nr:hypothetical protein [Nocardia jejuensis]